MSQRKVDILSEEVGLKPVALPDMKEKARDKIDRLQRKSAKPVGRAARPERTLRPAHGAPASAGDQGRSRPARGDGAERGERPVRAPRVDQSKGTPVAERPSDVNKKRPAKPGAQRPGVELTDRPSRKPAGAPVKRRSQPTRDGQRPGFGRGPKSE